MRQLIAHFALAIATVSHAAPTQHESARPPNVLIILCDDLNDWVGPLGGHPQIHTPTLDALAKSAVTFTNAHSNNPVCAPSRASLLSGLYPHTSGNLFWDKWFENPILSESRTLMQHARENGYRAVGSGKVMHHFKRNQWDEFPHQADYGPIAWSGTERIAHPSVPEPFRSIGPIDGSFGPLQVADDSSNGAGWIHGTWGQRRPFRYEGPAARDLTPDERVARWAARRLRRFAEEDTGPFLMAVGFIRPHTPMIAPQEYFDRFPIDDIELPTTRPNDAEDTHFSSHFSPNQKGHRYHRLLTESYRSQDDGLRHFTRAYLASVAFVDAQIGTVLAALEETGLDETTVVIVTSDHGFSIGEKNYLFKNAPWEDSTRVPLIIRAPGISMPGARTATPVSLIDIYPTIIDVCDMSADTTTSDKGRSLDGHSLRPLLAEPATDNWSGPPGALTMIHAGEDATHPMTEAESDDPTRQHWSLRTKTHRYIRYNSGAVELYDHRSDPHEWTNIADDPDLAATRTQLETLLRRMIAPLELGEQGHQPTNGPPERRDPDKPTR